MRIAPLRESWLAPWAYLLGPVGALLAIPLTIAIRRVLSDADVEMPDLGVGHS